MDPGGTYPTTGGHNHPHLEEMSQTTKGTIREVFAGASVWVSTTRRSMDP